MRGQRMDKEWLDEKIHESAVDQFDKQIPDYPNNETLRLAWQKVESSQAFQDYRQLAIKQNEKEITQKILAKLEGLKDFFGDENV